jgi:hypothetical protein
MTWPYTLNLKEATIDFLDMINSFRNVIGYKIHLQKSIAFLYTNNEQNEKNIGKQFYSQ